MSNESPEQRFAGPARLRERLAAFEAEEMPSGLHDARILRALRATRPRRIWMLSASLAASFLLGVTLTWLAAGQWLFPRQVGIEDSPALTIPGAALRGAGGLRDIPVEQADAALWYGYIEGLLAVGRTAEAERHLRRFLELHPDYVHQP